ncbi:MAG: winged helix-turn-helix transcriptional regulator [Solirubrobacterales bacterium]
MKEKTRDEPALPCGDIGETVARYLLALLDLDRSEERTTQVALARAVGVSAPSALEMVRRLRQRGLVAEGSLSLTPRGTSTALVLASRRDAARRWTHEVLGLDEAEARAEAEHLALNGSPALGRKLTAWRRSADG